MEKVKEKWPKHFYFEPKRRSGKNKTHMYEHVHTHALAHPQLSLYKYELPENMEKYQLLSWALLSLPSPNGLKGTRMQQEAECLRGVGCRVQA